MATLLSRQPALRTVHCTHCDRPSEVAVRAMSVFCPHCQKRLILEDYTIKGYYGVREFATCGDIVVERSGRVSAKIKTGTLVVRGQVQGDVRARQMVRVEKNGQLKGEIHAPALHIENGGSFNGFVRIGVE
ncbi:MAG: polymer-forming cytoskeletal protein [Phycisphaerae bacterium]|nr:polymer-forming cytoskeletal protein [Phycisphaerae bacterium]